MLGRSIASRTQQLASGQALSGTGALRLAGDFLKRFAGDRQVYLPTPSWANHQNIFTDAGENSRFVRTLRRVSSFAFVGSSSS